MGEVMQLRLHSFEGVKKFKSIRRAIKRGNANPSGIVLPKRPFNNRKNRDLEILKKKLYVSIKEAPLRTEYAKYLRQITNKVESDGPGLKAIIDSIQ